MVKNLSKGRKFVFKKKKNKRKQVKEIELPFKKPWKKKPEVSVHIKEEDHYAVLEPFDLSKPKKAAVEQKTQTPKKFMIIKKEKPKEEVKTEEKPKGEIKPEEVKRKLIVQKIQPKEIKLPRPIQKTSIKPTEEIVKERESMSKIPINHIETDIDRLIRIIDEKKIVGLDYLSRVLKISVNRLETWAKMLEDRGLIEIEYPIFGLPKLRKKEWKKKS